MGAGSATAAPGRPAAAARPATTSGGWHFAKPYRVPHLHDAVNGLACPTAKECIAVSANKVFWTLNAPGGKGTWHHAALEPYTQPGVQGSVTLDDVSCASAHECVIVDDLGNVFVSSRPTGGRSAWSGHAVDDIELLSVGCSAAGLCAAINYYGDLLSTANPSGVWARGSLGLDSSPYAEGVSCVGKNLCVAVSGSSKIAATSNASAAAPRWHVRHARGSWEGVACPSTSRCIAVGGNLSKGKVAVSTKPASGGWSTAKLHGYGPNKIDGASASACFADNDYSSTHPVAATSAWKPVKVSGLGSQTAVSCPTARRCYLGTSTNQIDVGNR